MNPKLDDRAREAARSLHAGAVNRPVTAAPRRGRRRELALVAAAIALVVGAIAVVATNSDDQASITPQTRPAPTVAPTVTPQAPNCGEQSAQAPWPRTRFARATWAEAGTLVATFAHTELGLPRQVPDGPSSCSFQIRGDAGPMDVILGGNETTGFFVSWFGYEFSLRAPLSIQISGLHVEVHTTSCPGCSHVMNITYADTEVRLTSTTGAFEGDLPRRSSGPGTIVVLTRNARGQLVRALGTAIPDGNFAVS
jgi:hypothetical protein